MTSTNRGTGFYIPFFPITLLCLTYGIPKSFLKSKIYNILLILNICSGILFSYVSVNPRINSNFNISVPYLDNLKQAGWGLTSLSPRDANISVARIIRDSRAIVIRDDAWVNSNGIGYNLIKSGITPNLGSAPYGDPKWIPSLQELEGSPLFILGKSPWPYHYGYDFAGISLFLTNHGYSKKCEIILKKDVNTIEIYGQEKIELKC